jgi:AcrR family transcriptional regulator
MTVEQALPSGRHGLSREFVRAHQRERLLRAVSRACVAHGYLKVTVADIVAEAHVSRRAFYSHYASKEECFLAAFEAQLQRLERRVARVCTAGGPDWQDRSACGLAELLQTLAEQPEMAYTVFVAALSAGPRAIAIRQRAIRRYTREVPLPEGAPSELAESVVGAVIEIIYQTVLEGQAAQLPWMHRDLLYCLLVPLVGDGAANAMLERAGAFTGGSAPEPPLDPSPRLPG